MQDRQNVQINTQRIPVGSSVGALVLIVVVLVGMFLDLPGVRGTAVGGSAAGLLLGAVFIWRRRRTAGQPPDPTLGITSAGDRPRNTPARMTF
jgi:membrane associated rhomboid family serine protease